MSSSAPIPEAKYPEKERLTKRLLDVDNQIAVLNAAAIARYYNKDRPSFSPMADLYEDILGSTGQGVILDPGFGQTADIVLQRLEHTTDVKYAKINAYFIYDNSIQCVVKLAKVSATGWEFDRYYKAAPLADVLHVFNSCPIALTDAPAAFVHESTSNFVKI